MVAFLKESLAMKYNVYLATDACSALAKLGAIERPDLIISEIMMDGMDGHSFLTELAVSDAYSDIPFIFLTAASTRIDELRGLSGGAIDCITKPFLVDELDRKLASIIVLRKRMKRHEVLKIRKDMDNLFFGADSVEHEKPAPTFNSLCNDYGLTAREREILKHLLAGLFNKEIAFTIGQTQRMVEYFITSIFRKVGVTKRYDLLAWFRL